MPLFAEEAEKEQVSCEQVEVMARTIMKARQANVSASEVMKVVKDSDLMISMTVAAYKAPKFSVNANKTDAVDSFANKWFMTCYEIKEKGE